MFRNARKTIKLNPLYGLVLGAATLGATEHRGLVKFSDVRLSGVPVTVSQADKEFTSITDDQGIYSFPNLTEGKWKVRVEMPCFETRVPNSH